MTQNLSRFADLCQTNDVDPDLGTHAIELTSFDPNLTPEHREALTLLVLSSLLALREGSTRVPLSTDAFVPLKALVPEPETTLQHALEALESTTTLVGPPDTFKPLIVEGDWLYHHRTYAYERRLVHAILQTLNEPPAFSVEDAKPVVAHYSENHPQPLTHEQQRAVVHALTQPLAVITGGPGTGKTSIVVAILAALEALGVDLERVAVAAPTGKAANRIKDSVQNPEPSTLHRLLGYSPNLNRFRFGRDNPLPHRFVIVDEASMVDLVLMDALLQALRPGTHLILLGDAEQLPSVDTGTILRDLVPPQPDDTAHHVVRLTHSHRMRAEDPAGRQVLEAAQKVRNGDLSLLPAIQTPEITLGQPGVSWFAAPGGHDILSIAQFVDGWFQRHLAEHAQTLPVFLLQQGDFSQPDSQALDALLQHMAQARILCVTRRFRTGADALNDALRRRFSTQARGGDGLLPGMPIMMLKNDYHRRLYNGDQGLVVRVNNDGVETNMAVFRTEDTWRAHHLHALQGVIDLSFAMTVHKAQGSEFDEVAVVLPEADLPILTRENLYTALTRARRSVFVYGSQDLLTVAIQRKVRRFSGVAEKLHARNTT